MTYQQTLDYMFEKLPMYQRIGGAAYKADLENTHKLCRLLGNPENKFRSIHVAGTNGKGSTSHLIASVLQQAGLKTGLYTSPHYRDFRERIKINGKVIPEKEVVHFINKWKDSFEPMDLSFFEMTVGLAFDYFVRENVDIAVIEVGMGGRLDSTNVITPVVSVITNIGMDHMKFLGNSLREIAGEKAGIIKPGVPVVIGETQEEIRDVFVGKAQTLNSPVTYADQLWTAESSEPDLVNVEFENQLFLENATFRLGGSYQHRNLCTALEGLRIFSENTKQGLLAETIAAGIANVPESTGLIGRWQTLSKQPLVICDSGHNADGIRQVIANIDQTSYKKLHFVFGMVNDKSLEGMLSLLPKNATYYFCKPDIPRGLDAEILDFEAAKYELKGTTFSSVGEALLAAKAAADADDLVFVGGSTFVVAEVV